MSVMSRGVQLCRAMSTVHRSLPFSKAAIKARKPRFTSLYPTKSGLESPKLAEKFLRHAERVAWELGVVEEMRAFEEAAAAFPNPPPIVAATLVNLARAFRRSPILLHSSIYFKFPPLYFFFLCLTICTLHTFLPLTPFIPRALIHTACWSEGI